MAAGADAKGRLLLTKPLSPSALGNPEKFAAIQAVMLVDQQGNPVDLQAGSGTGTPAPITVTTVTIPADTALVHVDTNAPTAGRTVILNYSVLSGDNLSYATGQLWAVRTADEVLLTQMEHGGYGPDLPLVFSGHIDPDTGNTEIVVDNAQPDNQVCSFSFFKQLLP